jgi:hypothetical protein
MMADITREDEVHCRLIQKCDPNLYEDQHILQPGTENRCCRTNGIEVWLQPDYMNDRQLLVRR